MSNDRTTGRGGGTCVYINNRIKYCLNPVFNSSKDIEIQSIVLTGNSSNERCKEINVVVVYRPPNGSAKKGKEELIRYCESLPGNLKLRITDTR